jgi:exonuclease SbcC
VAPLLDAAGRAAATAGAAREAETRARSALEDLVPADAAPETLHAAAEEQRTHLGRLDLLRAVADQAVAEDETAATARFRAARLDTDLASAVAEATGHDQAQPEAAAARDTAVRAATELPAAQSAAEAARGMAADSAALARQRAERDRMHGAHVTAREAAVRLLTEVLRIREARIDGMRAELAASMTDGSPCPVCGSLDHPDPVEPTFEPVSRDQEETANDQAAQAAAEADKAGSDVAAAEARIAELANRLDAAGFAGLLASVNRLSLDAASGSDLADWLSPGTTPGSGPADQFSLDTALCTDPSALAAAAARSAASAELLEAEAARLKAQAETLAVAQRELDDLDDAIAAGKTRLAELSEQRTAALAEADAAVQRAADRREELRAQLGDAADLEEALAATRRLADALTAAADAADDTVRTTAEAQAASDRAMNGAIAAGFGTAGTVEAAREAFREPQWRRDTADRITSHEAETEAVTTMLADPDLAGVALEPAAPVAAATEEADAAQRAHVAAVDVHSQARSRAEQLGSLRPQLQAALAAIQPLKERADQIRHLADLANGTSGANQYKMTLSSFVLAARLEEVAAAASERLLTMTAGRYSLVHSDARRGNAKAGLSLLACDAWTGIDRDTATLSGGETFLASLALALGLADVVTAESAGTPMEALFVDEGFGTLDEDTLDEVMNVLDSLRAGGRLVGIVSHVTELRQRIPAQVHVRKGRTGSRVEIIAG